MKVYCKASKNIDKLKSTTPPALFLGKLSEVSSTAFNQTEDPVVTCPLGEVGRKSAT